MPELRARHLINGFLSFLALAAIVALFVAYRRYVILLPRPRLSVALAALPYYAFCSYYRMLTAYVVALLFSLFYGTAAASSRMAERFFLPQSTSSSPLLMAGAWG